MAMQNQHLSADQHVANGEQITVQLPKVRLFHEFEAEVGALLTLGKDQAHYLSKVLRLQTGSHVGLFNQDVGEWRGEIESLRKSQVALRLLQQVRPARALPPIELAFAPLRKERMAFLIEKAVELGVTQLQPLTTEFTNWKFNAEKMEKTVMEAIEQCERVDLPKILPMKPIGAYVQSVERPDVIYAALERDETATSISELESLSTTPHLLIGPEGGWSARERELLNRSANVEAIWLGDLILRAETAGIAGLALLQSKRNSM